MSAWAGEHIGSPWRDPAIVVGIKCQKGLMHGKILQLNVRVEEVERLQHMLLAVVEC